MPARVEEIAVLLQKARQDIVAGRLLADAEVPDIVCFHAQQATEKAIKAVLALQGVAYPFRHNLDELMGLSPDLPEALAERRDAIAALTEFAIAARYEDIIGPDRQRVEAVLAIASFVYETAVAEVLRQLPDIPVEAIDEDES
ncbi:MAG: HEPN domain-containing protein [Armatimonadia bacterium]